MRVSSFRVIGAAILTFAPVMEALADGKGRVQVTGGFGYVAAEGDLPGIGTGGLGELQYSLPSLDWLRFYAGGIWATRNRRSCGDDIKCDVSASLFFTGAKLRMTAPIPYARPFVDIGLGLSAGTLTVQSGPSHNNHTSGIMLHVPIAFGVQFGRQFVIDVGGLFMAHPGTNGNVGAMLAISAGFGI